MQEIDLLMQEIDLLTKSDTEYKQYMQRQKAEEKEKHKAIERKIDEKRILSRAARGMKKETEKEQATNKERIRDRRDRVEERRKVYSKMQKKLSARKTLAIKVPHFSIKIRKAEPKPEQKPYFKPVKSNVGFFGKGNI